MNALAAAALAAGELSCEFNDRVHLFESVGASVRVTTLTGCLVSQPRGDEEVCARFAAVQGSCEPWRID